MAIDIWREESMIFVLKEFRHARDFFEKYSSTDYEYLPIYE